MQILWIMNPSRSLKVWIYISWLSVYHIHVWSEVFQLMLCCVFRLTLPVQIILCGRWERILSISMLKHGSGRWTNSFIMWTRYLFSSKVPFHQLWLGKISSSWYSFGLVPWGLWFLLYLFQHIQMAKALNICFSPYYLVERGLEAFGGSFIEDLSIEILDALFI